MTLEKRVCSLLLWAFHPSMGKLLVETKSNDKNKPKNDVEDIESIDILLGNMIDFIQREC